MCNDSFLVHYLVKTDHTEHFKGDRLADDRKNELS